MENFAEKIVKYRNKILVAAIVLLFVSVIGYFKTGINYDLLSYLPSSSESMEAQKVLEDYNLASVDFLIVNGKENKERHSED